jgi:HSP20 family protein
MTRSGPWRRDFTHPIQLLQSELNRLFDEYWVPAGAAGSQAPMDLEPASWSPAIDLAETPDAILLTAELPGVEPSMIDLSVTGNVLTLRGVKPADGAETPGALRERKYGPFHRQVALPGEVDFDKAQAEVRQGVLKIRLPRKESTRPRTIRVQAT